MAQYEGYENKYGERTVGSDRYADQLQKGGMIPPEKNPFEPPRQSEKDRQAQMDAFRRAIQEAADRSLQRGGVLQGFQSGATRTADTEKFDYEGFLSPLVIEAFAEYMHTNRGLPNGGMRASDNWQLGIPFHKYMKSLFRHFMQLWFLHRGWKVKPEMKTDGTTYVPTIKLAALGILFNTMGYLHEYLKDDGKAWTTRKVSDEEDLNFAYKQPGEKAA